MSSAALARTASRVAATPASTGARRHASAKFAAFKVKKNNWVESNEILRENKFYQWTITKKNLPGLLVMTVGFPVLFYTLNKDEQIRRDANYKKMEQPRQYL